jgi:hypothetical protein
VATDWLTGGRAGGSADCVCSCSRRCEPTREPSPLPWMPTAMGWKASSTPGPWPSWSRPSAMRTGHGLPRRCASPRPGPSSMACPRCRSLADPVDQERWEQIRATLLAVSSPVGVRAGSG